MVTVEDLKENFILKKLKRGGKKEQGWGNLRTAKSIDKNKML